MICAAHRTTALPFACFALAQSAFSQVLIGAQVADGATREQERE